MPSEHDAEPFPDQITGRGRRFEDDRPLPPVTYRPPPPSAGYRPHPGAYVDGRRATLMPLPKNGPAKASLILIVSSLISAASAFWWLASANPALADLVNLVSIALLVAAFILAIVGVVVAVGRPTKMGLSVFALVASSFLLIGVVVLIGRGLALA